MRAGPRYDAHTTRCTPNTKRSVRPQSCQSHPPTPQTSHTNTQPPTDASLKSSRTSFDRTVSTLRFLGTNGLKLVLQFWYAKQALFWIPQGWVPRYVEWILAFPKAPTGSVSIQVWGFACASVVGMVGEALAALWVLGVRRRVQGNKQKMEEPMPAGTEKKEL